jgi:Transposase, Mutator family
MVSSITPHQTSSHDPSPPVAAVNKCRSWVPLDGHQRRHAGLVNAIASVLPGAAWQRSRTHYHHDLLTRVPKSAQPWVSTLARTIFEQPDAKSVRAQHAQAVAALEAKLPPPRCTWTRPVTTSSPSPPSPAPSGGKCGPTRRSASTRKYAGGPTLDRITRYMGTEILAECRKAAARKHETRGLIH